MTRHPLRRSAFTLVELLVVIGIIALLIAILLPALSHARKQAATIKCLSNIRQLMMATLNYTAEWKGTLPYTNYQEGASYGAVDAVRTPGWAYEGKVPGARGSFALDDLTTGQLWTYIGGKFEVFRCPLDLGPWDKQWYTVMTTYCANGCMGGDPGRVPMPPLFDNPPNGKQAAARKIHRFKTDAIMFWEVGAAATGGPAGDGSNWVWEGITIRHPGRSTSIACLDGHAELCTADRFQAMVNRNPGETGTNPLWCMPDPEGGGTGAWDGQTHTVILWDN
jgi:prepilin-type N-terminal cleavage/methylation domain-containing protein